MQPDAERFLEARFEDLRRQQPRFGDGEPMRPEERAAFVFGMMLRAIQATGAATDDEVAAWESRVRAQLGLDRPTSGQRMVLRGDAPQTREPPPVAPPTPPPPARFLRMLPVASAETDAGFGGRLQVLGIELYDTQVGVNWRLAPLPDAEAKYAQELADFDRDAEGLDEWERQRGRRQLLLRLSMGAGAAGRGAAGSIAGLADDVGTAYQFCGGGVHGGPNERVGRALLAPAPPGDATELTVSWEGRPVCRVPLVG